MNEFLRTLATLLFAALVVTSLAAHIVVGDKWGDVVLWCAMLSLALTVKKGRK